MASFINKLKKNSRCAKVAILSESEYYNGSTSIYPSEIPMMNVAFGAKTEGTGLTGGILMIAGDSKHFKTGFMLEAALGFQNTCVKNKDDYVILFYDSEKGAPINYFETRGINMDQVLHCPIYNIEDLKNDLPQQLKLAEQEGVKVMVMVDSIGMLPSVKEVQNSLDDKSTADMTRARELNSLFRIVTPMLAFGDFPMVVINHAYDSMDNSHAKVISGGKKAYLAADDIWIIGRQNDGTGADFNGFVFVINIEKSRLVKEKTKIFIYSTMEDGINRHSGLLEEAMEMGLVERSGAWFKYMDFESGEMSKNKRKSQIMEDKAWFEKLLKEPSFAEHLHNKYAL